MLRLAKKVLSYSPGVRGDPVSTSLNASTPSSKRQDDWTVRVVDNQTKSIKPNYLVITFLV